MAKVITFSVYFPKGHINQGKYTYFKVDLIKSLDLIRMIPSCFHPLHCGEDNPRSQKYIAEKWLEDQRERFPNGWVIKEGNDVVKREFFPSFHTDWNHLIECINRLKLTGVQINVFTDNIFKTWYEVVLNTQ